MYSIKFGTDGWRAIIAQDYTTENVARVAAATADWILAKNKNPKITLGYDCRVGGSLFAEVVIKVMYQKGVKVLFNKDFCTTPILSFATQYYKADIGVMITASHNPPSYNGYKLKSTFGGPSSPAEISEIEALIPSSYEISNVEIDTIVQQQKLEYCNFSELYEKAIYQRFDIEKMRQSGLNIAYDAMFGGGQSIVPKLFPNALLVQCEWNPRFNNIAPEPIPSNLEFFAKQIKSHGKIDFAFANDGDADRIALMDKEGNYIDAHMIILMLIYILHKYHQMHGKVVVAFSVSPKIAKMCEKYGLPIEITPIGFKYIAERIMEGNVLVGGEESGGISVAGHIPERDGIWDALIILEYLSKYNKTLDQLIEEVNQEVGAFAYGRNDLRLTEHQKVAILDYCKTRQINSLGGLIVEKLETIDGFKYHLEGERVLMIRASGTEPLLRVYCQAETKEKVQDILENVSSFLKSIN
jgi:phosphomannomutase